MDDTDEESSDTEAIDGSGDDDETESSEGELDNDQEWEDALSHKIEESEPEETSVEADPERVQPEKTDLPTQ